MSRALALLLSLCALVLPAIARAHGRVDVRVPARASGAVVAELEGRVGSPEFLQRDPEGYVDSVNVYAAMANDPVNNRDPTGRYKVKKHWYNDAGQIIATAIDFDDGSGGERVTFEPYDPNSFSPRNLVNRMKATNALYRAELQRSKERHIARVASEDGSESAAALAYVYGSGTLADQPQQIYDIADGLISLAEGDTDRARRVGLPAATTWATHAAMATVVVRATVPAVTPQKLGLQVFSPNGGRSGAIAEEVLKHGSELIFENFTIASTGGADLLAARRQLLSFAKTHGARTLRFKGTVVDPALARKLGKKVNDTFDIRVDATAEGLRGVMGSR